MNELLERNLRQIRRCCKESGVEKLHAFGSIATDGFTDESDIDLLVKFKETPFEQYADNYFRLHEKLQTLLKRKVDLVTTSSLSNPYFIRKVDQTKTLLYDG